MAKYHGVAKAIGVETQAFCERHKLTPAQRKELLQLMFGSTRIASGGRLQFSTRVNSYMIIGEAVEGVSAKPHTVEQEASKCGRYPAKSYESVRFEAEGKPDEEEG